MEAKTAILILVILIVAIILIRAKWPKKIVSEPITVISPTSVSTTTTTTEVVSTTTGTSTITNTTTTSEVLITTNTGTSTATITTEVKTGILPEIPGIVSLKDPISGKYFQESGGGFGWADTLGPWEKWTLSGTNGALNIMSTSWGNYLALTEDGNYITLMPSPAPEWLITSDGLIQNKNGKFFNQSGFAAMLTGTPWVIQNV